MAKILAKIIGDEIRVSGPIPIDRFMRLALVHPEHGYYVTRDPLGGRGDFTTAPEISQMFGEMIGAWAADFWQQMGAPDEFILLECGPGRGTLMADLLRATKHVPGFHEAVRVHLLEISPALRASQKQALSVHSVQWHSDLRSVPDHAPIIFIANEFLDALGFVQLQKNDAGDWCERVINYTDRFCFELIAAKKSDVARVPTHLEFKAGDVFEFSPAREDFVNETARRIKVRGGAALFIDYGYARTQAGESFQALKDHQFVNVLTHVGEADLTSHVDFEACAKAASGHARVDGPITQGTFLRNLGIELRAGMLSQAGEGAAIKKDLHRLIDSSQMGELFKVLCVSHCHEKQVKPAGF